MSGMDRAKNKGQELAGKAKEAVDKVHRRQEHSKQGQGRPDEVQPQRRREKVKDAFKK